MTGKVQLMGLVEGVYVAADPDTLVSSAVKELDVSLEGIVGDRHYGLTMRSGGRTPYYPRGTVIRNSRQVSIVSTEDLQIIRNRMELPFLLPDWLGANLLISGLPDLTYLPAGTRLAFPRNTVLVVTGENLPCSGPARVIQAQFPEREGLSQTFLKQAMHLRGVVAWVERPGTICAGEEVQAAIPEQRVYQITERDLEK